MESAALARQRVLAWLIDASVVLVLLGILRGLGWWAGGVYVLLRDGCFDGQSVGKRCLGLKVVTHRDRRRCTVLDSAIRNVLWVMPIVQVVMGLTGLHALMHEPQGRHWGDRLAGTQVVSA